MEQKNTILIVDDEPSARDTLEALLWSEGYELAFAASGQEALDRLEDLKPDVILLDVMMPGMNGFEVCQRLKANEQWRPIPVILITALDSKEDLVRGLDAGADDFLHKPVNGPELRARVRSMLRIKRQHDELEATLRLREDLSNMIVHDMRSPLASILLHSQLLAMKVASPDVSKHTETIRAEAQRLDSFINDILMLAKMEHGQLILSRSPVDVNQIALEAEKGYSAIAQSRQINLVVDLPEESQRVSLDANLFRRVLDNLLSNALKFSPAGSTVTLRITYPRARTASEPQAPHVRIQVLDEGPGIPEEHRQRIFNQFEIVALRQRQIPQIGLGLAFCKMVIEAHGGRIFVEANEPKGSVFTIEI